MNFGARRLWKFGPRSRMNENVGTRPSVLVWHRNLDDGLGKGMW